MTLSKERMMSMPAFFEDFDDPRRRDASGQYAEEILRGSFRSFLALLAFIGLVNIPDDVKTR